VRKSRSGDKMMNLGPDKLMACKLNTIELREIKGTSRSNINSRNQTLGLGQTLSKNKLEQNNR
jgi:hypothetical protein